jgi:hypothetical protein
MAQAALRASERGPPSHAQSFAAKSPSSWSRALEVIDIALDLLSLIGIQYAHVPMSLGGPGGSSDLCEAESAAE